MTVALSSRTPKDTRQGGHEYAHNQGMAYICGAGVHGMSVQMFRMTSAGSPETLTFAQYGLSNMADDGYAVFVKGHLAETTNPVYASAKTKTGMTLTDGTATEVQDVFIVGRVEGQLGPAGP